MLCLGGIAVVSIFLRPPAKVSEHAVHVHAIYMYAAAKRDETRTVRCNEIPDWKPKELRVALHNDSSSPTSDGWLAGCMGSV